MLKRLCDVCGKECCTIDTDWRFYSSLYLPVKFSNHIVNSSDTYDMCVDCATKFYNLTKDFLKGKLD